MPEYFSDLHCYPRGRPYNAPFWFDIFTLFLSIRGAGGKPKEKEPEPANG